MEVSINFSIISTEDIVEESSISPRFLSGPSIHVVSVLDTAKGMVEPSYRIFVGTIEVK